MGEATESDILRERFGTASLTKGEWNKSPMSESDSDVLVFCGGTLRMRSGEMDKPEAVTSPPLSAASSGAKGIERFGSSKKSFPPQAEQNFMLGSMILAPQ